MCQQKTRTQKKKKKKFDLPKSLHLYFKLEISLLEQNIVTAFQF